MKKEYIKPEMEVSAFDSEVFMLGGSSLTTNNGSNYEEGDDLLGRGRRGSWGNLWSEGEE